MNEFVKDIDPSNKALQFIDKRINDTNYRGNISSQHNRYTMDDVFHILVLLNKYVPNKEKMIIRTSDIKKRPENLPEEQEYAKFCNEAKQITKKGTQDAMRKNLFVDIHRMGFIERFDKKGVPTNPFKKQNVKYVALSDLGLRFINAENKLNRYFIFSKGLDTLLGGFINIILHLLRYQDVDLHKISTYEFMFFVSAVNTNTNFNLSISECVDLILEYRNLSKIQRKSVVEILRDKLQPKKFKGTKSDSRDFHNWKNKIDQMLYLFKQTVYFEIQNGNIILKTGKEGFDKEKKQKNIRSISEKIEYFKQHKVKKTLGFELHHVLPLSWAESQHQFKLFDCWLNMLYIDAFSHAKITQNKNRNIIMTADSSNIKLSDYLGHTVDLEHNTNILYLLENQQKILKYNRELIKTC